MARTQLSREDWLAKGIAVLTEEGAAGLRAEKIARELGTTKGSFYWHFEDVPSFLSALLASWHEGALTRLVAHIETHEAPVEALRHLPELSGSQIDRAVRAWAHADETVSEIVNALDARRLKHISKLLRRCDVPNPDLARALYAAMIGFETLPAETPEDSETALATLVDLILALR